MPESESPNDEEARYFRAIWALGFTTGALSHEDTRSKLKEALRAGHLERSYTERLRDYLNAILASS